MEWRPIEWFPDGYEVSNHGDVRVLAKSVGRRHYKTGEILKAARRGRYLFVILHQAGQKKMVNIHRLVAAAFLDPSEVRKYVNHKNGDRDDNRAENLEWCTAQENYRHALDVLGHKPSHGESHWMARFSDKDVVAMRTARAAGQSVKEIAKRFGCASSQISLITRGKIWAHIKPSSYLEMRAHPQ